MPPEILVAAIAAAAVLLITIGFASRPPKDAVQARLEQLVVQPKSLEEYELQAPFFERAVRPLVKRLARAGRRGDQGGIIARTDAKLEKAGYPGGLRGADWMGRSRRDALRDVAKRADSQPINNFIRAIVQAEQLGVPIAKVLQIQSNQLRIERRQRAEEAAAKAPVKMLFPMVGCIFPTIFIVILGPAILTVVKGTGGI